MDLESKIGTRMLTYDLAERGEQPLYEYLYESIKADVMAGSLQAGERMPSKRKLAQHLGVSLITVEGAYSQLIAEGYLRSVERRGYFVNSIAVPRIVKAGSHSSQKLARGYRDTIEKPEQKHNDVCIPALRQTTNGEEEISSFPDFDLTGCLPAQGVFPYNRWAFHLRKVLTEADERSLVAESGPFGSHALRHAIANFLSSYRGIDVNPDNIVIGAGSQVLYQLIVQLLGRDIRYALEDPGYSRLAHIYRANGVSAVPIPLNDEGIDVERLHASGATVAHVMPTHQYPTGQITSIARRYELLAWAASDAERYIIEDDHDSELQFSGHPIPSLQSIDTQHSVIYLNTFTKSLGPAFRLSYMILPDALAHRFQEQLGFYSCTANAIDQLALTHFMDSGEYERHINRLRTHFRSNVTKLAQALKKEGMTDIILENAFAGSHCLMRIGEQAHAREFAAAAEKEGVLIRPLEAFLIDRASTQDSFEATHLDHRLFIDHATLTETEIDLCVEKLLRAYQCRQ